MLEPICLRGAIPRTLSLSLSLNNLSATEVAVVVVLVALLVAAVEDISEVNIWLQQRPVAQYSELIWSLASQ
jgi:uncharacterized membrane protein